MVSIIICFYNRRFYYRCFEGLDSQYFWKPFSASKAPGVTPTGTCSHPISAKAALEKSSLAQAFLASSG